MTNFRLYIFTTIKIIQKYIFNKKCASFLEEITQVTLFCFYSLLPTNCELGQVTYLFWVSDKTGLMMI